MNRREWIQSGVAAAAAGWVSKLCSAEGSESRVIDTHTHFYDPTRPEGVPWPAKDTALYRTVLPKDWLAVAAPHGVRETVVVEASDRVEDNQWILDLAEREPSIVGFVGNLDPADAAFARHVKRFAAHPLFVGVRWRSGLVDLEDDFPTKLAGARTLAAHDLELDLNGRNGHSAEGVRLARGVPELRIVINHLGGPANSTQPSEEWKESMKALADCPNVNMKVSALVEQARTRDNEAPRDLEPYLEVLDFLWDAFGEDRLVYGSNWPVSDRGAPYEVVIDLVRRYFKTKGPVAEEKYFSGNAKRIYRWVERQKV